MMAVIQRVSEADVTIEGQIRGKIKKGFVILIGMGQDDTEEDLDWLGRKVVSLRIMADTEGKMNLGLKDVQGDILLISQFTLHASTKKGNRPSFTEAARPEIAIPMYNRFIALLETELGKPIQTGEFGADMKVRLINDGPVTIVIDTKNKK